MTDQAPPAPAILGLPVAPLPAGWVPLEYAVVIRCLTPAGERALSCRTGDGDPDQQLAAWDAAALFLAGLDKARAELAAGWHTAGDPDG